MEQLNIIQASWASIGIFGDYPEILLRGIAELQHEFTAMTPVLVPGHREKFCITVPCTEGTMKVFLKAKFHLHSNAIDFYKSYIKLRKDAEQYPARWRDALQRAVAWDMRRDSVVNEICVSRIAQERYLERFDEELPIERSIGFVVDRMGHKWGIFEFFDDIIRPKEFSRHAQMMIRTQRKTLANLITRRLPEIGVVSSDVMNEKNILIRGTSHNLDSLRFVVVDTEDWMQVL
ncbi:MAG: hypothetical protein WCV80_03535 [Candidatus Paceibacterota bacterium]|jgi:hypothetical protein